MMELPKEPRLYQLKKGFAKRKGIPIYFTAIPITQTEKAVYLYGHGTLETLAMGVCWMCGCTLTHPVSKALGVGPICGKHAYDWDLVGGYTEENIKRLKEVILQKAVVDTWVPKSVVIEIQPTKEMVELPDTHPMAGNKKTGKTTTTKEEPENNKLAKLLRTKEGKLFIKIEFPFDRDLIADIKTLPGRTYKNDGYNNKYWLCPFAIPTVDSLRDWGFSISKGLQDWYDEQSKPQDLSIPGLGGTLYPFQREGVETLERLGGRAIIGDDMGLGKQQPLDCAVLTPDGWTVMGNLEVGDFVVGQNGKPTKVTGVFPQGNQPEYEVVFTDGSKTRCGKDHLWVVNNKTSRYHKKPPMVKSTQELLESKLHHPNGANKYNVPLPEPIQFDEKLFPIHPYLLGVLLGDGYLTGSQIAVTVADIDDDITKRIKEVLPRGVELTPDGRTCTNRNCKQHGFRGTEYKNNPLLDAIRKLELDVKSPERFIPGEYLLGSVEQRLDLLRGLMDTDGGIDGGFTTSSEKLAYHVVRLVQSLGGVSYVREYKRKDKPDQERPDYQVVVKTKQQPFYSERKKKHWKPFLINNHRGKFICSIKKTGRTVPQQCISVANKDGLYITDDFIVTHNTVQAVAFMQLHQEARPVIVICPANAKMVWARHAKTWLTNPTVHLIDGYPNGKGLPKPSGNDIYIVNYDILANRYIIPDKEKVKEVWDRAKASLSPYQMKVFKKIQTNWDKLQKTKSKKWNLMGVVHYEWEKWCENPEFVRLQEEWFGVLEKEEKKGWVEPLLELNAPILIIDECHRIKHKTAARTLATLELIEKGKYVVPMSGTPIERHPDEFYTVLSALRPDLFGNWKWYMSTFCDLKHDGYGWNTSGAINTEQLNKLVMGTVMIRRLKKDVLPDLPKKQRALVPLEVDLTKYNKVASDVIGYIQKTKGKEAAERAKDAEALVTIEVLLQACMEAKLKPCIEWLENFLESDEKVVVFAHHRTIVDAIFNHFKKEAVQIVGGMSPQKRQEAQDQFQTNPNVRMLVGSIMAASEAITLTAASNTVTLEITRKPSTHFQAEDRVLRIGQEADSCNAYYLVAAGTIEEEILDVLNYREKILAQVQDGRAVDDDTNDMFTDLLTKLWRKTK